MNSFLAMIGLAIGAFLLALVPLAIPIALPTAPAWGTTATPPTPAQQLSALTGANEREQWAIDLLSALGNSRPAPAIIAFVVEWTLAEDGGSDAFSRNNPLNTTICGFNMIGAINADGACGVGHYASYQDGIDANAATLGQGNFSAIREALLANDPEGARQALWASPWASSHYGGGADWPHYDVSAAPGPAASALPGAITSNPIAIGDDACGWNIKVALDANGGALRHVQVAPGETFSFNASMGTPAAIDYRTCAGVPGGNWCNLAARYAQVARGLGLTPEFEDHGAGDLGGGPENSVAIWNLGGRAGSDGESQDLIIRNTTDRVVTFRAQDIGGAIVIEGAI